MRTHEEYRLEFARLLKRIRRDNGLSVHRIADIAHVDDHTWARYEVGKSAPNVIDFAYLMSMLGEDALPGILAFIHPDLFGPDARKDISDVRNSVCYFFEHIATDTEVREMDYLINGNHGSCLSAQIAMCTMIDHLPLNYRVAVAELVDALWRLAESRGELIGADQIMPDVDLFRHALRFGSEAAYNRQDSYNTLSKD